MMRNRMRKTAWALGLTLWMGGAAMTNAQVTVRKITYNGWKGAYQLTNKTTELVFVPQIGRIMRYGFIGGANLLWNNRALDGKTIDLKNPPKDWQNFGGDKCWPAPQSRWGWPPDPIMEAGRQSVRVTAQKHLIVTGQAGKREKVRFIRDIALDAAGSGVTMVNTLTNTGDKPDTWAVWQITQTDNPDLMRMPLYKAGHFPDGFLVLTDPKPAPPLDNVTIESNEIHVRRDPKHTSKIGGDSPLGWIIAEKHGTRLRISTTLEAGKDYPDGGCALEIYTNDDPNQYVELELLGPLTALAPKAQISQTTRWELSRP